MKEIVVLQVQDVVINQKSMFRPIQQIIEKMNFEGISLARKEEVQLLIDFIQTKKRNGEEIHLNFICTHNSRRSQFSQVWAKVASCYYSIPTFCYSGGVEVTAFNERAVNSLKRFGFQIEEEGSKNPHYLIYFNDKKDKISTYSKLFDAIGNPTSGFAAIMTCSHADENCPYVPGCEKRIPIRYEDPKEFDDTPLENALYDYRSFEIATELFYVFSNIK